MFEALDERVRVVKREAVRASERGKVACDRALTAAIEADRRLVEVNDRVLALLGPVGFVFP